MFSRFGLQQNVGILNQRINNYNNNYCAVLRFVLCLLDLVMVEALTTQRHRPAVS